MGLEHIEETVLADHFRLYLRPPVLALWRKRNRHHGCLPANSGTALEAKLQPATFQGEHLSIEAFEIFDLYWSRGRSTGEIGVGGW